MPFVLFVSSSDVRALLLMPTLSSLYCGISTKFEASWKGIGSQKSRCWDCSWDLIRKIPNWRPRFKICMHWCVLHVTHYELLLLQNQLGPDSPHINYQQLKSPLQSLSQEEMITGDQEICFSLNCMIIFSNFSLSVCCMIWVWIVGSPLWIFILMTCGNRLLSSWNRLGYWWRYLYHADLLESLPLLVLHCVGQDRLWLP